MPGGQIVNSELIEDFPGFSDGIGGFDLGPKIQSQAEEAGVDFKMSEATAIHLASPYRVVMTGDGQYQTRVVIIAGGSTLRALGLAREGALHGAGVSYCASCDGPFFVDQTVGVVGGGDAALDEALTLSKYASRVIIFHRRSNFRAQKFLQEQVSANPKIEVCWNTEVTELIGESQVEAVATQNTRNGEIKRVDLSGLFIFVGLDPNTDYLNGLMPLDSSGHIETDISMATPIPGIFAVGDIRQKSVAKLIAAAGDGATSAVSAFHYINSEIWPD
jgi:thioredoxin reductase (NADPH)